MEMWQALELTCIIRIGPHCDAKPTTLKRLSPGDGFENHMYLLELELCAR